MIDVKAIDETETKRTKLFVDGEYVGLLSADKTVALLFDPLAPAEMVAIAEQLGVSIKTPVEPPVEDSRG